MCGKRLQLRKWDSGRGVRRHAFCYACPTMRNSIDFSSWQGVLSTLLGLVLVTVVAVGIRLVVMQRLQ